MLCALSGQTIVEPVVSPASGRVFERSLIEAYIDERGLDPISHKPLSRSDLVILDIVPPNPELVKSTSIPGLLKALQTEFNALVIENHELTESLRKSRQEVESTLRVISELKAEQNDLNPPAKRFKPSKPTMPRMEEAMRLHPSDVVSTQKTLCEKRKEFNKLVENLGVASRNVDVRMISVPRNSSLSLHVLGDFALLPHKLLNLRTGSEQKLKGQAFWIDENSLCQVLGKRIQLVDTDLKAFTDVTATLNEKIIEVLPHPAAFVLVRTAKSIFVFQSSDFTLVKQLSLACRSFAVHPDGELLFVSTTNSEIIKAYSFVKLLAEETSDDALFAELPALGKNITCLTPSPNGYLLAYILDNMSVCIIDLRFEDLPHVLEKSGQPQAPIRTLSFDGFGVHLLVSIGKLGLHIFTFSPTSNMWSTEVLSESNVSAAQWHDDHVITI